jgi:hypothetical protein
MTTITEDKNLTRVSGKAGRVKPDDKRRIVLPHTLVKRGEDIVYHVYYNDLEHIILIPQATIPASELWLFKNKDILASIDRGMAEI